MLQQYSFGTHPDRLSAMLSDLTGQRAVTGGLHGSHYEFSSGTRAPVTGSFESELHRALFPGSGATTPNRAPGLPQVRFESSDVADTYAESRPRLDDHVVREAAERLMDRMQRQDEDEPARAAARAREQALQERLHRLKDAVAAAFEPASKSEGEAEQRKEQVELDLTVVEALLQRIRGELVSGDQPGKPGDALPAAGSNSDAAELVSQMVRRLLASIDALLADDDQGAKQGQNHAGGTAADALLRSATMHTLVAQLRELQQLPDGGSAGDATEALTTGLQKRGLDLEQIAELLQRLREDGGARSSNERVDPELVARLRAALDRKALERKGGERARADSRTNDGEREGERLNERGDGRVRVQDLRPRSEVRRERSSGDRGARTSGDTERSDHSGRSLRAEMRLDRSDGADLSGDRATGLRSAETARQGFSGRAAAQQQAEAQLARHLRNELPEQVLRQAQMVIRGENDGEMRLSLNPPELGGVRVRMQIHDNLIAVRFIVENNSVRDVFEQNLHSLQQQLADSGFENAGIEVSVGGNSKGDRGAEHASSRSRALEELEAGVPVLSEMYREDTQINLIV